MTHAYAYFLSLVSARTLIVACALIGGLRLLGKRQIGQMNIYDLALIMALSNGVQNAMTGGKGDLSVGIVSAGTLFALGWVFSMLFVRVPKLEQRVVGSPSLIVSHGKPIEDRMRRERVTMDQLMTAIRQHGLTDPSEVMMGILEVDGSISIVPRSTTHHRTKKRIEG